MIPLKLMGLNDLDDGSKIARIKKGNVMYIILIPPDKVGPKEMKYVQKEVIKHEQQFTSGQF